MPDVGTDGRARAGSSHGAAIRDRRGLASGASATSSASPVPRRTGPMVSLATRPARSLLGKGDTVAVVSPGFGVRAAELARGTRRLESLGFRERLGDHALDREGYLAGTDEARAEDLNRAIAHPDVRAVWFARGGYGAARLLDLVRWDRLARAPKTLIGYS